MEALKNMKMVEAAREAAKKIVQEDPDLEQNPVLASRVLRLGEVLYGE